jgi:hypothetical protein
MWKRVILMFVAFTFAFGILFVSVFRTAAVKYEFNPSLSQSKSFIPGDDDTVIDYYLPYPGRILPDSPLWSIKALRDKLWLFINTNPSRKAELLLLFADKRIGSSVLLFTGGKYDDGFSALSKAEKYLEEASQKEEANRIAGYDTGDFLVKIANASLKHYQLTQEILSLAPDEVKPGIINLQVYSKKVFERSRNAMLDRGLKPPENPFDWE